MASRTAGWRKELVGEKIKPQEERDKVDNGYDGEGQSQKLHRKSARKNFMAATFVPTSIAD